MKHLGGWSFIELYNLPVGLRNWFFKRTIKHLEEEAEQIKNASKK
jgi:hypothetical protein